MSRPYKGTWEESRRRRERIVELNELGWSAAHIGREMHLSTSSVHYHLRIAGKTRPSKRTCGKLGQLKHSEIEKTIRLYESGLTLRQVGAELGLTHSSVRYRLLNAGVTLRAAEPFSGRRA